MPLPIILVTKAISEIILSTIVARWMCSEHPQGCGHMSRSWNGAWCRFQQELVAAGSLVPSEGVVVPWMSNGLTSDRRALRDVPVADVIVDMLPRQLFPLLQNTLESPLTPDEGVESALSISNSFLGAVREAKWSASILEKCKPGVPDKVVLSAPKLFVVVPGLGRFRHLSNLKRNLMFLRHDVADLSCVVYMYASVSDLQLRRTSSLLQPCHVVRTRAANFAAFLLTPHRSLWADADFILIMLPDVVFSNDTSIPRMAEVMKCNDLSVLAPSYHPRCCACNEEQCTPKPKQLWYQHWRYSTYVGRRVSYTELNFNLMTISSFECLRRVLNPQKDPLAWSAVFLFPFLCAGHCQGILDEVTMYDVSRGSYNYRASHQSLARCLKENFDARVPERTYAQLLEPRTHCYGATRAPSQQWPHILHADQLRVIPALEELLKLNSYRSILQTGPVR